MKGYKVNISFKEEAFGKNDLRGLVDEVITPELFEHVGKAYAEYLFAEYNKSEGLWVSVAQDARKHSPKLTDALIKGLLSGGINILNIGIAPSPLAYFSEYLNLDHIGLPALAGSLVVTASHNPPQYNGLKLTCKKHSLSEGEIKKLKEITFKGDFNRDVKPGIIKEYNIIPDYIESAAESFGQPGK